MSQHKKKKVGPERITYHHNLTLKAGHKFMTTVIEESFSEDVREPWIKEWLRDAKSKKGINPIDFISEKANIDAAKVLAWGSRHSGIPIIDCEHVAASNNTHYIIDGLPMTLVSSSEIGAITIVHSCPFLETFLDTKLIADIYGAIKVNFALAHPDNYLRHIEKLYTSGRVKHRLLVRAEEDPKNPSFPNQVAMLEGLGLVKKGFSRESTREEILEELEENRPEQGASAETEWYALTSNIPFVQLAPLPSNKELLEILLPTSQKSHGIIPVCEYGGTLTIAAKRILRGSKRQEVMAELQRNCKINSILSAPGTINEIITANMSTSISTTSMARDIKLESTPEEEEIETVDIQELANGEDATVIKLVQTILIGAVNKKATDIHIAAHPDNTWVRYRVDGNMVEAPFHLPFQFWKATISRIKIMSGIDIKYSPVPQDGKFPLAVGSDEFDIRVNVCPTIYGEKAILRVQRKEETVPTLEGLGFQQHEKKLITNLVESDHGLLIICGPTGSGKTTTLSAVMYSIDRKRWNVITAENPVEIRIPHVEQTPIDGSQMTFGKFVPAALRQDPDYIMIGETRDKETTEEVIRAAITGHIVMTTLHTNSAAGAPARLIDMGAQPFLITDALKAVCAQRLIRRLCTNCARPARRLPTKEEMISHGIKPEWFENCDYIMEPVGCKMCNNTGYRGRIAIIEGFSTSPEIRRIIIHENADSELIREEIVKQGGKTLYQHAMENVAKQITSITEALTVRNLD
jgi:type II secretory ATPase GspE/PulE/Tfp pilus assembly ATPase PilB-like protein